MEMLLSVTRPVSVILHACLGTRLALVVMAKMPVQTLTTVGRETAKHHTRSGILLSHMTPPATHSNASKVSARDNTKIGWT